MNFKALFFEIEVFLHKIYYTLLKLIKMAKKKRNLDIEIKTKKVNINIERKDGKLDVEIDTPAIDVSVEKDAENLEVEVKAENKLVEKIANVIIRKITKQRK